MREKRILVRLTSVDDLDKVMVIYANARERMAESGNPNQWIDGYPTVADINKDICNGVSYIIEIDGIIAGVFTYIIGKDPTYEVIDGEWLNDNPYGTIHRIAAAPGYRGVADICLDFCKSKGVDIRIDTHADNTPMLGWISSRGFSYCGVIHCHNGTPRKAFHLASDLKG